MTVKQLPGMAAQAVLAKKNFTTVQEEVEDISRER